MSRYYDPEIGRFINADALASTGQDIIGFNMFAYCNNNPVMNADSLGMSVSPSLLYDHDTEIGKPKTRDVTEEFVEALKKAASKARKHRALMDFARVQDPIPAVSIYMEFYT